MTRRPGVTLVEVLVSMFIMAIGMLALLVLFPLGALTMGQALADDRCATTAAMADNFVIVSNIRHDRSIIGFTFPTPPGLNPAANLFLTQNGVTLPQTWTGPSFPVYVDPYGAQVLPPLPPVGGLISRVQSNFVLNSPTLTDRWFSLPDDVTFDQSGTPDPVVAGGIVQRERRFSYALMLIRPQAYSDRVVQMSVVVYRSRPIGALTAEPTFPAAGAIGTNGVTVGSGLTTIKRGGWILDPVMGTFYRVTNLTTFPTSTVIEVQPNLTANINAITVMENVQEVFDRGTSWQP
jgi:prepilin-type N-terminal cleavage/methylation domain-containing protein